MGANYAALGVYRKSNPKNKVYYVNRLDYAFSYPVLDESGKKVKKTNTVTGYPIMNSRGEPEYVERSAKFSRWQPRFTDLGYWAVYEVTPDTDKTLADELENMAANNRHEVMDEKTFIKFSNPMLLEHIEATEALAKEKAELQKAVDELKTTKSRAEEEIQRLKQKAGLGK